MSRSLLEHGIVEILETEEQDFVVWYFVHGKVLSISGGSVVILIVHMFFFYAVLN